MKRVVLLLVSLLGLRGVAGVSNPAHCWLSQALLGASPRLVQGRNSLNAALAEPKEPIQSLKKASGFIDFTGSTEIVNGGDSAKDDRGDSTGATNGGIYKVRLARGGTAIAKLVPAAAFNWRGQGEFGGVQLVHPNVAEPLLIQKTLADLGMAPKLYGVMNSRDALRWRRNANVDLREGSQGEHILLVMEALEKPWNVGKSKQAPEVLAKWSEEDVTRIVRRVKQMEVTLERLGVDGNDAQVFLMPDGRVILGDIDHYTRLKPGQKREKFDYQIQIIVDQWQAKTGKVFPAEEIAALRGFALQSP